MTKVLAAEDMPLSEAERERLVDVISADLLGYGPIQPLLADPTRVGDHGQRHEVDLHREERQAHRRRHHASTTRPACAR